MFPSNTLGNHIPKDQWPKHVGLRNFITIILQIQPLVYLAPAIHKFP